MKTHSVGAAGVRRGLAILVFAGLTTLLTGCPQRLYNPTVDPNDFVSGITNTYLPLTTGKTFVYVFDGPDGTEENRVSVTSDTKTILGVTCTVVHDVVRLDGEITEDTLDWFAQDTAGNVWYFGEDSKEYEDGVLVSTEGSWEAGVDDAKPGIVMPAQPRPGLRYRQEFAPDVAEDMAAVVGLHETVTVPYGTFTDCLKTREFTPLERGVVEYKYYAPGVGQVLTETSDGREELTAIETK